MNSVQFEMQSDTCPGLSAEGGVQYCIMIKVTVGEGAAGELEQQNDVSSATNLVCVGMVLE